jgi:hypothetical protein
MEADNATQTQTGTESINVPADGSEPEITFERASIHVSTVLETKYGTKAILETEYEAKDDVKALDWDRTHRSWDKGLKAWTVDIDALNYVVEALNDAGRDVTVTVSAAKDFEYGYGGKTRNGRTFLPDRRDNDDEADEEHDDEIETEDEGDDGPECEGCGVPIPPGMFDNCSDCKPAEWKNDDEADEDDEDELGEETDEICGECYVDSDGEDLGDVRHTGTARVNHWINEASAYDSHNFECATCGATGGRDEKGGVSGCVAPPELPEPSEIDEEPEPEIEPDAGEMIMRVDEEAEAACAMAESRHEAETQRRYERHLERHGW